MAKAGRASHATHTKSRPKDAWPKATLPDASASGAFTDICAVALGLATGAFLGWGLVEPWRIRVRRFDVRLQNLPPEAEGFRVVQISDLHAGLVTPLVLTRRILSKAQEQQPDLIVLTGDLVSRRGSYPFLLRPFARPLADYARRLVPLLRELRVPLGLWAVAGNHDFDRGTFSSVQLALEEAGVRVLVNQSARLENGLALVGLDDLRDGSPDVHRATRGIESSEAQLALLHNPRSAALFAGRNALILSGHTHGGQIALPPPFRLYPVDAISSAWQSGWWRVGRAQLYVSSGAGHVKFPFRVGVPPEICVFTLKTV